MQYVQSPNVKPFTSYFLVFTIKIILVLLEDVLVVYFMPEASGLTVITTHPIDH